MKKLLFYVLLIGIGITTKAQDPNFHIYLCFGQSNMEGQGTIETQDQTVDSRFQILQSVSCTGKTKEVWRTATPPLSRCATGLGPADYFGREMVKNLPSNIKIGIVHVAIAGSKIELFDKNNYQSYVNSLTSNEQWMKNIINEYGGNPYARLVTLAKLAQKDGVIKGILLHQGESNSGEQTWPAKVNGVYTNLLTDLNLKAADVPLLAGQVVDAAQGGLCAGHNTIINGLPNTIKTAHVISSAGCTDQSDNLHFTSAGYRILGARYAQKMLTLLPSTPTGSPTVSMSTPANNATFETETSINLSALAEDSDGSITKVEFYAGNTLLGTSTTKPFSYTWIPTTKGTYSITAKATDNSNNTTTSSAISIVITQPQGPYNGIVHTIPGIIQAEEFDEGGNNIAYMDDSPGSDVTPVVNFRTTDDVDIENCTDVNGGYNIGYAKSGEWLEYTVDVTKTGLYDLDLRVACSGDSRTLSITMDGNTIANNVAIPNTTGWQSWQTITVKNVNLTAGKQIMRITIGATSYININYVEFKTLVTGYNGEQIREISVYPNPFVNGIKIDVPDAATYSILDMMGNIVEQGIVSTNEEIGQKIPSGMYLIKIESSSFVKNIRVNKLK